MVFHTQDSGEILGFGRNVFMGYINREIETKEAVKDGDDDNSGWLRLGDLGVLDGDGFLVPHGRREEEDIIALRSGEVILPHKVNEL